jgi:hypothetical protein
MELWALDYLHAHHRVCKRHICCMLVCKYAKKTVFGMGFTYLHAHHGGVHLYRQILLDGGGGECVFVCVRVCVCVCACVCVLMCVCVCVC